MKTIWFDKENEVNTYAEFVSRFVYESGECLLDISADAEYEVYINGKFVGNGQYPDYPFYKVYDRLDITGYCVKGENLLAVRAYHDGLENSSVYYPKPAGLAYRIFAGDAVLAESDEKTLARRSRLYKSGDMENITRQLGYSFRADMTADDDWTVCGNGEGFAPATVTVENYKFNPRPIKKCVLSGPLSSAAVMQGYFVDTDGDLPSMKMQNALFGFERFPQMTGRDRIKFADKPNTFSCDKGDGIFVVYDLGKETAGYLTIDITVDEDTIANIAYGEHRQKFRVCD